MRVERRGRWDTVERDKGGWGNPEQVRSNLEPPCLCSCCPTHPMPFLPSPQAADGGGLPLSLSVLSSS